ncbi:hypothetical protein HY406_01015, partial [Candidatus Giovannonibacteria bacterium]|nr:hypothetical protein [Candidatus Giovannonibacteria bacterium]
MAKKEKPPAEHRLHPDAEKSIWAIALFVLAVILTLAFWGKAGLVGAYSYELLSALLGWGYLILPAAFLLASIIFLTSERQHIVGLTLSGAGLLIVSVLGLIEIISPAHGGWLGLVLGSLQYLFGQAAAIIVNGGLVAISVIVILNVPLRITWSEKSKPSRLEASVAKATTAKREEESEDEAGDDEEEKHFEDELEIEESASAIPPKTKKSAVKTLPNYVAPPLALLKSASDKPTTGDLLANANIIKRTLDSFG